MVHYVLYKRADCKKSSEMWFKFDGKPARFLVYEFAVMGLRCGELPVDLRSVACQSRLWDRYFQTNAIKTSDLLNKIQKWQRGSPKRTG